MKNDKVERYNIYIKENLNVDCKIDKENIYIKIIFNQYLRLFHIFINFSIFNANKMYQKYMNVSKIAK